MGSLLATLHLPPLPPKESFRAVAPKPRREELATVDVQEMELVEDKGARWVDREVDDAEIAAFMAGAIDRMDKPANPRPGPVKVPAAVPPVESSKPAGTAVVIPVSLSIKYERSFKYVQTEKLKVEGELKFEDSGEAGVVKTADVIGVSLDKRKLAPAKKIEIDLKKLTDLLLGRMHDEGEKATCTIDPKLECKVGPGELNVSLGITVSGELFTGSMKLVMAAKETGKDWEFARVQCAPFGVQFKDKLIDLDGAKGKVSGKLTVGIVLKPEWRTIATEVATRVGRPVLTTIAEALTAEAAIVAGLAVGAAAQVFAYAKSVSEWRDVRDCAEAAEKAWLSFYAGFGSAYGLKWKGAGVAELRQQGAAAAAALLAARLATTRKQLLAERGALPAGFDAEWRKTMNEVATKNPDKLGIWIERNFRRQILDGFLRGYAEKHGDDYLFEQNFRALRTLLGVGG